MEITEEQMMSLPFEELNALVQSLPRRVRPVSPPIRSDFKDKLFYFANVAVESYNSNNQGNQFEIVDPLYYKPKAYPKSTEDYHLSFIARSKDDSSILKLFFAEVSSFDGTIMATKCIIVDPCNPLFVIGCGSCHPEGVIYHPFHYRDPSDYRRLRPLHFRDREYCAKRLLSEAYIISSFEQNLYAEDLAELKVATYGYICDALAEYNDKHHASFKPLAVVSSVRFGCKDPYINMEAVWVHFVFKAITKDSDLIDASPKYFFAERGLLSECITTCVMMGDTYPNEGSAYHGTEIKCSVCRVHCPSMLVHPEDYRAGRDGENLADVLDKGQGRTVKAKLEQKDTDSSKVAHNEYFEALER